MCVCVCVCVCVCGVCVCVCVCVCVVCVCMSVQPLLLVLKSRNISDTKSAAFHCPTYTRTSSSLQLMKEGGQSVNSIMPYSLIPIPINQENYVITTREVDTCLSIMYEFPSVNILIKHY